ncbi:DNA repair protein REV1 [Cytospora mali]|uniref:DNA repair protein REV1 n=1 Tax=Cytospora mali TaxID=578113 RepID=A0A194WDI6_CYTMA|nr:DNA repair protein REV1 [Valsa mali]
MPATPKPTPYKAAEPKHGRNFDPWNSVALGHQRAETRGPQGWRENRTWKLQNQLAAGNTGGDRLSDAVGAGSEDYDEEHGVLIPKEVRARATNNVVDMLRKPGTMSRSGSRPGSRSPERKTGDGLRGDVDETATAAEELITLRRQEEGSQEAAKVEDTQGPSKIFDGLVVYINGSTHPLISDHKLKHVLVENGARTSIHLGRRQVTHVILGRPSGPSGGAGGGLAGGKLEKEIRRVGGCGVKYVGVEWILESIKAGRRLPETRFANLKVASRGQPSVYGAFSKAAP